MHKKTQGEGKCAWDIVWERAERGAERGDAW
jgi:hypothetical protein